MAFGGDVDTLSLTFDKLQYIFNGYNIIHDSLLEITTLHKQGNMADREFFDKTKEIIMRFSALEFLAIKSIFEIKKALDRDSKSAKNTNATAKLADSDIHVPGHSVSAFIVAGTLPSPNSQMISSKTENMNCIRCKNPIRMGSKFCINCGNKI